MGIKVSVIIPVYQSKAYLQSCVESILHQSHREIEVVLVDDGSSDGSELLCDRLAEEDARVRVIHQANAGTSAARNTGLEAATGDYITFMDNDDYWADDTGLGEMVAQLEKTDADVLLYDCTVYWQDTQKTDPITNTCQRSAVAGQPAPKALSHLIGSNLFSLYCVWGKLMRASLIRENGLRFPVGMRNEDIDFCGHLFRLADSYDWYEKPFYVYRKGHTGAQTGKAFTYRILCDLKEILERHLLLSESVEDPELRLALHSYLSFPYCVWMGQSKQVKDKNIKNDLPIMKQHRHLLRTSVHPSVHLVYTVSRVLGYSLTSVLLGIYLKKKNHLS